MKKHATGPWLGVLPSAICTALFCTFIVVALTAPPLHLGHLIVAVDSFIVLWICFHDMLVEKRYRLVFRPWFRSRRARPHVTPAPPPPQTRSSPRVPIPAHRVDGRIKRVGERTYERTPR